MPILLNLNLPSTQRLLRVGLILIAVLTSNVTISATSIEIESYPALTGKSMGHIRHMIEISQQLPGDWSYMYPQESAQQFDDAYRFQLAFMTYTMALAQHQYLPAYRELYQKTIHSFIRKMLRNDVWSYWKDESAFTDYGNFNAPLRTPNPDPVANANIMYSGHLLMMIGLYAALYDDDKYDEPGSIQFNYGSFFFPKDQWQTFNYDHHRLARIIYDQLVANNYIGIACEPNLVFPMCNQHGLLGLVLYDHSHGTNLSNAIDKHRRWYEDLWIDQETKMVNIQFKLKQQEITKQPTPEQYPVPLTWANGWTGTFMHVWNKEFVESLYKTHIKRDLKSLVDGTYAGFAEQISALNFGFTATYAAEMGDAGVVKTMLDFADNNFKPTWINGRFFYPRNDVIPEDEVYMHSPPRYIEGNDEYHMYNLTGHSLLALARINQGDGLWKLFNQLPNSDFFQHPFISGVSYPEVLIETAVYDTEKQALIIRMIPGTDYRGRTSITVNNLSHDKKYKIQLNEQHLGELNAGKLARSSSLLKWSNEKLIIYLNITSRQTLIIQARENVLVTQHK